MSAVAGEARAATSAPVQSGATLGVEPVGTFTIGGDLAVRRLGFGAMRISGARNADGVRDRDEARRLVRRIVDRGGCVTREPN